MFFSVWIPIATSRFQILAFCYEVTSLNGRIGQMIPASAALVCSHAKAHATFKICKLYWILLFFTRKLLNHFRAFDSKLTPMLKAPCSREIKEKSIGTNNSPPPRLSTVAVSRSVSEDGSLTICCPTSKNRSYQFHWPSWMICELLQHSCKIPQTRKGCLADNGGGLFDWEESHLVLCWSQKD